MKLTRSLILSSYVLMSTLQSPLYSQIYSKNDIKRWHSRSFIEIKRFTLLYNKAATDFAKSGPMAFTENFSDLQPHEIKWLMKKLIKYDALPLLQVEGNTLLVKSSTDLLAQLPLTEVSAGVFSFPSGKLVYNFKKDMIENYEEWTKNKSKYSWIDLHLKSTLHLMFLPEAHAANTTGMLIGAALGGIVAVMIANMLKKKNADEMGSVSEGVGGTSHDGGQMVTGTTGGTNTGGAEGGSTTATPPGETDTGTGSGVPQGNEDILAGCKPYINPYNLSSDELGKMQTPQKELYTVMRNINQGGGYDKDSSVKAVISEQNIDAVAKGSKITLPTSMCSSASGFAHMVFLRTLGFNKEQMEPLMPKGQTDGVGPWGIWNANGPGTASYFQKSGAGTSFAKTESAAQGDFLKILWKQDDTKGPALGPVNNEGHSVVFLGCQGEGEKQELCMWGSHKEVPICNGTTCINGSGIGVKCVPKSKLGTLIYSHPNKQLPDASKLERDDQLVKIQSTKITKPNEVRDFLKQYGI